MKRTRKPAKVYELALVVDENADRWPLYGAREQRALEPTGKWRVPRYEGLDRDAVRDFFVRFLATDDEKWGVNIQESADYFFVFLEHAYPPPSTRFLNGELIRQWHLSTDAYWAAMRQCNEAFRDASTYHAGEALSMWAGGNTRRYGEPTPALPKESAYEAFNHKRKQLNPTVVTVRLEREHYQPYVRHLFTSTTSETAPLISCAMIDGTSQMNICLQYPLPGWIMNCVSDDFGRIDSLTFVFSNPIATQWIR